MTTLLLKVECCQVAPVTLRSNLYHHIQNFQFSGCSLCKIWPMEKKNHGYLQECWSSLHKCMSHLAGERYIFYIFPSVSKQILKENSTLTIQSPQDIESLPSTKADSQLPISSPFVARFIQLNNQTCQNSSYLCYRQHERRILAQQALA